MLKILFNQVEREEEKLIVMKKEEDLNDPKFEECDGKDF